MGFPESIVKQAFERAGGHCESCDKQLVFKNRGRGSGRGAWEAHHRTRVASGGDDTLSNCKILCEECHIDTL